MELLNQDLIESIRSNVDSRNKVIKAFYENKHLKSKIAKYVLQNGGEDQDIESCFVDSIIAFAKRCYRPDFALTTNADAYIYTIARNNWIAMAKKRKQHYSLEEDIQVSSFEVQLIDEERKQELKNTLKKLDEKCREVLLSWAQNYRMREIAIKMHYKSEGMARKKKFECMQKLKALFVNKD